MMTKTNTLPTVADVLAKIQAELAQTEARRIRAEEEVDASMVRISVLTNRISSIHAATSTLAGLPSLDPEQTWLDHLIAWRRTLIDELSALPTLIRDARTLGLEKNLTLSLRAIDEGPDVTNGTGYDVSTLRLGRLMMESGFELVGADPDRNYAGTMPWHGTLPQVERRVAMLKAERAEAEATLSDALLGDAERELRAAEARSRIARENAKPVRKMRGDGSEYDRYPDGRIVEVETVTA